MHTCSPSPIHLWSGQPSEGVLQAFEAAVTNLAMQGRLQWLLSGLTNTERADIAGLGTLSLFESTHAQNVCD